MPNKSDNIFHALERIFHEPNRLAILSALSSASHGLTFRELKEECGLTDGNLSRHLKALEEAKIVAVEKKFVGSRPRTTVILTDQGRERFIDYLQALEEVLKKAADALAAGNEPVELPLARIKPARA
ncbi:MAG: ArsR family transcriptional regulator [Calditrichaeota bacterium]|nr:MAG: ArsR family transcriptional regulator [Calditrichota bacterium]